jgi:hypothetical protein
MHALEVDAPEIHGVRCRVKRGATISKGSVRRLAKGGATYSRSRFFGTLPGAS